MSYLPRNFSNFPDVRWISITVPFNCLFHPTPHLAHESPFSFLFAHEVNFVSCYDNYLEKNVNVQFL